MNPSDTELQRALHQSLHQSLHQGSPTDGATQALEERVMAQWAQRHAGQLALQAATAGGPGLGAHGQRMRRARWAAGALAVAVLLAAAWLNRPDPALEELMQPDVLQLITLGGI